MKKLQSAILIILIISSTFTFLSFASSKANADSNAVSLLEFNTLDNLEIQQGEDTIQMNLKHNVTIPASPLADIYREALGASNYSIGEEMPIPENVTVSPLIAVGENLGNTSQNSLPIRKQFYEALSQEYDNSLGLDTLIVNSSMIPQGDSGECRIYADAMAFPRVLTTIPGEAGDTWTLGIGPTDSARFAGYVFTQITFLKMLLQELPGEQVYKSSYSIRISLPDGATLLKSNEISGLSWLVDLGGGNGLAASLSVDNSLVLNETMTVTEQNTTIPMTDLCTAFQGYKSFRIEYSLPQTGEGEISGSLGSAAPDSDFSWSQPWTIIDMPLEGDIPLPPLAKQQLGVDAYAKYTGHLKLVATFSIQWEPTYPFFGLDSFRSSIKTEAELELKVEAGITKAYSNEENPWEVPILPQDIDLPIKFFIGPVPVDVDLIFSAKARLIVNFGVSLTVSTGYVANGWLECGVEYDKSTGQLQPFSEKGMTSRFTPPTVTPTLHVEIIPSLVLGLWARFYLVAGPKAEIEPYVDAQLDLINDNIQVQVTIGLHIKVGFLFDDNLAKLLRIKQYDMVEIPHSPFILLGPYIWTTHHDVGITNVEVSKTSIYPGDIVDISVTTQNQGFTMSHDTENFDVRVSYDGTEIDTKPVSGLTEGSEKTVGFVWNTKDVPAGSHTIKAELLNINPAEESDGNDYTTNNVFETKVKISPIDFYISFSPEKTWYKPGETTKTTVSIKNLRSVSTTFWLGASFKDTAGEVEKYDTQISRTPKFATLDPGQSTTFTVTWTIPLDAPFDGTAPYQIALNCWKDNTYTQKYVDNIEWADVFYVYKLHIITPNGSPAASAGDPGNPTPVIVSLKWIPTALSQLLHEDTTFSVMIGGQPATCELQPTNWLQSLDSPLKIWNRWAFGLYELKVTPPTQPGPGLYNLEIKSTLGELMDSDIMPNAIEYTASPPVEPIQKGLAWLRTQQYTDGSWYSNVGVTSLTALAFLNAGHDETDTTVSKAINYILSRVHSDGSIYASYPTYETSLAILALIATHNSNYATTVQNAKNWLVNAQQDESFGYTTTNYQYGGWTYWSTQGDPDLSNSQFALLALDAAGLPKTDPTWSKATIFLQRCQNRPASNDQPWAQASSQPSYNDGGFIYRPWGWSLAGGTLSYGSMTGAGIWGLLLSGVSKTDGRVTAAINWVVSHYTWDTNPIYGSRPYYYYLSMSKALTMYGEPIINGHDWYQDLYNKIVGMQIDAGSGGGYWSSSAEDYGPVLTTVYAILSLQTRAIPPPVQRLSYLTFILRSNCLIRIIDPDGNLVGYNYMTGTGENNIPAAVYSGPFSEPQYVVIVNPKSGTYKLELVGVSEGPYTLTIQGNYGEEVTKTFEYTSEIGPAELQGSQVTVTAIVGPIDVYTNPPEFEKIIDNTPPKTTFAIGNPEYTDGTGKKYITSGTPLTLTAEDNVGGTGVASTYYRVYNTTGYDTGMQTSTPPIEFHLTGIDDGEYSIDFYSVDRIGNIEAIITQNVTLDNMPPTTIPTIGDPKYISGLTYVTPDTPFTLTATDTGSGVNLITYRINSTSYDSGWLTYTKPFSLTSLPDGYYTIAFNSTDNVGNVGATHSFTVTLFSWNYIYQDTYGRGTTLKINLAHKFFQFIRLDKDYGIRVATYMKQCGRAIIISHCDKQLRLITVSVDTKIDFCYAMAWDLQTRKCYLLIDKAGIE